MRGIDKHHENVQRVMKLHCEYVVSNIKKEREEEQRNIYYNIKALMNGRRHTTINEEEFRDYRWITEFIAADVEQLRWMAENYMPEMQYPTFRAMYESNFIRAGEKEYSPVKMVDILGIKVCPYCDRNYIDNVCRELDGKKLRGNQLDHFFPKGKFPMLAMCFYNLIPVCASCNLHKHERQFSMNPYEEEMEEQTFFDIKMNGKLDENELEVNLLYTSEIRQNIEILALKEIYKGHVDIAYEIVTKSIYYNRTKKMELCRNYPQLFKSIEEVDRILYGMDFMNLNQRPLQKFYKDILKVYKE